MTELEVIECGGCAAPVLTERQADQKLAEGMRAQNLANSQTGFYSQYSWDRLKAQPRTSIPPASRANQPLTIGERIARNAAFFLVGLLVSTIAAIACEAMAS